MIGQMLEDNDMLDARTISTDEPRQRLDHGHIPHLWNVLTSQYFTGEIIPGSNPDTVDPINVSFADNTRAQRAAILAAAMEESLKSVAVRMCETESASRGSDSYAPGMARTGTFVRRRRRSVVDPSSHFRKPPRPRLPITIKSPPSRSAVSSIEPAASPTTVLNAICVVAGVALAQVAAANSRNAGSVSCFARS